MHGGAAPQVKAKAQERIREYVAQMVDPDRVLQEAARMAFSDLRQAFDENGKLKATKDWPDELAAAVAATKSRRVNLDSADGHTDVVTELKVWDKPKNVELLAKHLGLLKETHQHQGELTIKWEE
jgi:phage terminase small subunit